MRQSTFHKHIQQLSEEDLKEELLTLFRKLDAVKDYYKIELGDAKDRQRLYDKAKKDIASKFATKSKRKPRRPRIQKALKILSEVKKKALFEYELIDIYLFTAETAWAFMDGYEFYSTPLHNIIVNTYEKAMVLISITKMEAEYQDRAEKLIHSIRYQINIQKSLKKAFNQAYPN